MTPNPASPDMSLVEFFMQVYVPRRLPTRNPNTLRLYHLMLRRFAEFLGRDPLVSDLANEDRQIAFLESYGAGRSAVSHNKFRNHLMALAGLAHKRGLIAMTPELPDMPEPYRRPEALTADQVQALLKAAEGYATSTVCGIRGDLYWQALLLTCVTTGLRVGALFAVRRVDVDLDAGTVFARAETQKQFRDQRLRIPQITVDAIRKIWEPERPMLFPWVLHQSSCYNYLRPIIVAAGLPNTRRQKFHALRRTCATFTHRYGGDATSQLGHSSDAVTRESYLDPDGDRQSADVVPWGALLSGPPDPPAAASGDFGTTIIIA